MNECHSNANISAEAKGKNNKTIFIELQSFKFYSIFYSFKTATSYRRDFNSNKFSKSILKT